MEHVFLQYEHAEVFFTYGFLWRSTAGSSRAEIFAEGLTSSSGGWKSPFLHERIIGGLKHDNTERLWIGSYQPSFVLNKRCLEWEKDLGAKLVLAAPLARGVALPQKFDTLSPEAQFSEDLALLPVQAAATIRLFDTGSGVVTLRIQPAIKGLESSQTRFEALHLTLRLSPNMDLVPEEHAEAYKRAGNSLPICDSFLFLPGVGTTRLFRVMEHLLNEALQDLPREVCSSRDAHVVIEQRGLAYEQEQCGIQKSRPQGPIATDKYDSTCFRENQAPFTFVVCIVDEESSLRLRSGSIELARELGSIYARLTLDNRFIATDFLLLSEEYLTRSLGYDPATKRLPNHGHDDRLFLGFSRRGALAVTARIGAVPNVFVVPSLLNLLEIIRARLTSGILVGTRLARIAERLAELDIDSQGNHTSDEQFAYLRRLVVQNQQSPLEHLFDGGTVSELALLAEEALLANRVWRNVQDSFEVVDRLRSAWLNKKFRARYGD